MTRWGMASVGVASTSVCFRPGSLSGLTASVGTTPLARRPPLCKNHGAIEDCGVVDLGHINVLSRDLRVRLVGQFLLEAEANTWWMSARRPSIGSWSCLLHGESSVDGRLAKRSIV
jgi:hypothetical protein